MIAMPGEQFLPSGEPFPGIRAGTPCGGPPGEVERKPEKERKFEDVVKSAKQAAVLVLVY